LSLLLLPGQAEVGALVDINAGNTSDTAGTGGHVKITAGTARSDHAIGESGTLS